MGHARPFNNPLAAERKERTDDRKQDSANKTNWKELIAGQEDFLKPLIREVVQQVLEAEMDEALGAEKGERTPNRVGYRAGYYGRTLVTRVGKLSYESPKTGRGVFAQRSSSAINAARKRWWQL